MAWVIGGNDGPLTDDGTIDDILCGHDVYTESRPQRWITWVFKGIHRKVKIMLHDIDCSKAIGFENIPPKLLKAASQEHAEPATNLVN